ncbi:MAG TPA: transcriptional activator NhaR [Rhodocyclaceae bacterium]
MRQLNYKHLRYFWAVAKAGSVARASERLHLAPHSISGQLRELEENLGVPLFQRVGRGLELTDMGRRILSYAEEIFALGDELLEVARDQSARQSIPFAVGIADSVPKTIAYRLVEPALQVEEPIRLICREGRLNALLADLAVHKLDMVIADRAMPSRLNVRGYSHLLGESEVSVCARPELADRFPGAFPARLDGAPFLLPGEDSAIRTGIERWFETNDIHPRIVGEFDDSALLKAFAKAGAGFFATPKAILDVVAAQYGVNDLGLIDGVREELYAITTERRLTHPAIVAISEGAKLDLFAAPSGRKVAKPSGKTPRA